MIKPANCRILLLLFLCVSSASFSQDSLLQTNPAQLSCRYYKEISSKADNYYNRVTSKTEKTLERLSRWEGKIKRLLEKANPEAAQRLFGNDQLTFSGMLQRYREGKAAADGHRAIYDGYRDKLTTSLKYLDQKNDSLDRNVVQPLANAKAKMDRLNSQLNNTEAVQRMIKERRKQIIQQAAQYIGQSKYFKRINKDVYYAAESLQNYKKLFSEPGKAEETTLRLLQKVPAFNDFMRRNSELASLFRVPGNTDPASAASLAGLQTRAQINSLIQQQLSAGGASARQQFSANLRQAQSQLNELKNKITKAGGGSSDAEQPEGFTKNEQRGKRFIEKWGLDVNVQNNRASGITPVSSDVGISASFKPNNWFTGGLGVAGRIGWGKDIRHIAVSYSGISARSFAEVKLKAKGNFLAMIGFEMNYRPEIRSFEPLKDHSAWQKSGLAGIGKTVSVRSKFFKKTKLALLWDYLSYSQAPRSQPLVFRISYNIK